MSKDRKQRKKADISTFETKEQRFVRVATPRVKKAIVQLRLVKQTISGSTYSMTAEQIQNIYTLLENEIKEIDNAFLSRSKKKEKEIVEVHL